MFVPFHGWKLIRSNRKVSSLSFVEKKTALVSVVTCGPCLSECDVRSKIAQLSYDDPNIYYQRLLLSLRCETEGQKYVYFSPSLFTSLQPFQHFLLIHSLSEATSIT